MIIFIALFCACTLTLFSLKYFPFPYLWISLSWLVACLVSMQATKREAMRAAWLNLAVVALALATMETYAYIVVGRKIGDTPTYTSGYRMRDDTLGPVPVKGIITRSKLTHKNTLVYDVVYSIGSNGLRISPPCKGPRPKGGVLFFGCSFTFGEGLNDDEPMPYRVGILAQDNFCTYNFGFHGYGPHQMLAALERGLVEEVVQCKPTHVIYQAIPDHVARASGLYSWGRSGPRYILSADGSVKRYGHFDDEDVAPTPFVAEIRSQLNKSYLVEWLAARRRPLNKEDIRRFVGIVTQAKRLVEQKFPGCQFHVLLWNSDTERDTFAEILERFRDAGLQIHLIQDILPGYPLNRSQFEISAYDDHPNARANEIIAEYVERKILRGQDRRVNSGNLLLPSGLVPKPICFPWKTQ